MEDDNLDDYESSGVRPPKWRHDRAVLPDVHLNCSSIPSDHEDAKEQFNGIAAQYTFGPMPILCSQCDFVGENTLVFPVGQALWEFNTDTRQQRFLISLPKACTRLKLSHDREMLAVSTLANATGEGGIIQVVRRIRAKSVFKTMLPVPGDITSLAFSTDGKFIAAAGGTGNKFSTAVWRWEKNRFVASNVVKFEITGLYFVPGDQWGLIAAGNRYLRSLKISGMVIEETKLAADTRERAHKFVDVAVLPNKVSVAATDDHSLLVILGNRVFDIVDCRVEQNSWIPGDHIVRIAACHGGVAVSTACGSVLVFQVTASDTPSGKIVRVNLDCALNCRHRTDEENSDASDNKADICDIVLSQSGKNIVCLLRDQPPLLAELPKARLFHIPSEALQTLENDRSSGAPLIDCCSLGQTGRIVTCDTSRILQVWEPEQHRCSHSIKIGDTPKFVAGHPNGFQILVGTASDLILYHVLLDRLKQSFQRHIRGASQALYSSTGHALALSCGSQLLIYSGLDLSLVCRSPRHGGLVASFVWTPCDTMLCSVSSAGTVILSSARTGIRVAEIGRATYCFTGVAFDADSSTAIALTDQQQLFVLRTCDNATVHINDAEVTLDFKPTSIVFDDRNKCIVMGTNEGKLVIVDWPLTSRSKPISFSMHRSEITAIFIDRANHIVSVGKDGSILICNVQNYMSRGRQLDARRGLGDKAFEGDVEIAMVTLGDYEESKRHGRELETAIESLKTLHERQMREEKFRHERRMDKLQAELDEVIDAKNSKISALQVIVESGQHQFQQAMSAESSHAVQTREEMRDKLEATLAEQYSKYAKKKAQMEHLRQQSMKERNELVVEYEMKLTVQKEEALKAQNELLQRVRDATAKVASQEVDYEQVLRSMEIEHDAEFVQFQESNLKSLQEQEEAARKAIADASLLKRKFDSSQMQMHAAQIRIGEMENEVQRLRKISDSLKSELATAKKDIKAREKEISIRNRELTLVRSDNSKIQNFQTTLEHRINELTETQKPAHDYIMRLVNAQKDMHSELEDRNRAANQAKMAYKNKSAQNRVLHHTSTTLRSMLVTTKRKSETLEREIRELVETRAMTEWPVELVRVYNKYIPQKTENEDSRQEDGGIVATVRGEAPDTSKVDDEIDRQRENLEGEIKSLRTKLKKQEQAGIIDRRKKVSENRQLLEDNNLLRAHVGSLEKKVQHLELTITQQQHTLLDDRPRRSKKTSRSAVGPMLSSAPVTLARDLSTPGRATLSSGRLHRGSTHALHTTIVLKNQNAKLKEDLEESTNKLELQAYQLAQLQEGLSVALSWADDEVKKAAIRSLGSGKMINDEDALVSQARPLSAGLVETGQKMGRSRSMLLKPSSASVRSRVRSARYR